MADVAFTLDIGEWCKKAKKDVDRAARAIIITIFSGVIEKTPVDTGLARGNWQLGYDRMPAGTVSATNAAGDATGAVTAKMNESVLGRTVYLVNNLPYIGVLEYGGYPNPPKDLTGGKTSGGYSKQAPAGMVRVTVSEVSQRVQEGIAKGLHG